MLSLLPCSDRAHTVYLAESVEAAMWVETHISSPGLGILRLQPGGECEDWTPSLGKTEEVTYMQKLLFCSGFFSSRNSQINSSYDSAVGQSGTHALLMQDYALTSVLEIKDPEEDPSTHTIS